MIDVTHSTAISQSSLCEHCGRVVYASHTALRQEDRCRACEGNGWFTISHPKCGHYAGRRMCEECGGSGRKHEPALEFDCG